jgi:TonB family protein
MLERKISRIISLGIALALVPILAGTPATALGQQDSDTSSTSSTTNLGTLVVAPQNAPNQSSAPKPDLKVRRNSLNLNLGVSPSPSPSHGNSTSRQPQFRQPVQRSAATPLHVVSPEYPASAYARHIKGTVTVGFTINASGTTSHIHIIDSHPSGVFDAAARAAVSQWLFQPATENGQPVAENVSQTLVFRPPANMDQTPSQTASNTVRHFGGPPSNSVPGNIHPVHLVPPQYPPTAYRRNQGGLVTVSFLVDPSGRTSHIDVVYSKPRHTFDSAAKDAVRQWRFKPVTKPTKVVQTITFTPPD